MTTGQLPLSQQVRTLPIRVAPLPGEAMDSWLETLAARSHTTWGDLLIAVGLKGPGHGRSLLRYPVIDSTSSAIVSIATATGVPAQAIKAMALDAVVPEAGVPVVGPRALLLPGSRFCPACLNQNGGRWLLWWKLRYAFACPTHRCLLADLCPRCGGALREHSLSTKAIPVPGHCVSVGGRSRRCGADLSDAPALELPAHHPALAAQDAILRAVHAGTVSDGIYHAGPVPTAQYLRDLMAVGTRAVRYGSKNDLLSAASYVGDGADTVEDLDGLARANRPSYYNHFPTSVVTTAVAACAAVPVLSATSAAAAGDRLRWLVASARHRGFAVSATNIGWGGRISTALTGAQLSALTPFLGQVDQIRYRCLTDHPRRPIQDEPVVSRSLPAMLWFHWMLPVCDTSVGFEQVRMALSVAVVLADGRLTVAQACSSLGRATASTSVSRVLGKLSARPDWAATAVMLATLADYLTQHPSPIDYVRRRHLDTQDLLPQSEWLRMCRNLGMLPGNQVKIRLVRCWLYERLTGSPGRRCGHGRTTGEFRAKLADLPRTLNPELVSALDDAGRRFLDDNGLADEPLRWSPPKDAAPNWLSRKPLNEAIDIDKLHELVLPRDSYLGTIATHLGTSIELIREALNDAPAPRPTLTIAQRRATGAVIADARVQLTPELLADLYLRQRLTLRAIGETVGVSKQTVGHLAREYDIPLRPSAAPSHRHTIGTDQ